MIEMSVKAADLIGPGSAGIRMSAAEFDAAVFDPDWRYELINGVLVVTPATSPQERGPNEVLGHLLLTFQETHPNGSMLDATLPEHDIHIGDQRRRADRVIWSGLGRQPRADELPTIAIEFVSKGKRNFIRDYEQKRQEYLKIGIREYWIINRFDGHMTVHQLNADPLIVSDVFQTELLPGFSLPVRRLLQAADQWD